MDVLDLLKSSEAGLPKTRPKGDFEEFLGRIYQAYLAKLRSLDASDHITKMVLSNEAEVK